MKHLQTFLLVLIFWIISNLNAQINIQFNAVNTYLFSSKECLNFVAINSGQKSVEVKFLIKIDNNNNKVVDIESSNIVLNPGANVINANNLSIKNIQYYNSSLFEIEQKTGTFPSGSYTICAWSVCALPDCGGLGIGAGATEQVECLPIQVENPTPLLLSYPENNSEIEETRPVYTWIPPAPMASSSELNYLMTLVEINDGQTTSDALSINRPIIQAEGLVQNTLMHPNDIAALEPGKTYAWQVQAFVGRTYFAKSEQWKFKIKKDTIKKVGKQVLTFKQDKQVNPYYIHKQDSLLLVFEQNYQFDKNTDWNIKLIDEYSNSEQNVNLNVVSNYYSGLNGILLRPLDLLNLSTNKIYQLQLKSIKGELYFIRLIFKD